MLKLSKFHLYSIIFLFFIVILLLFWPKCINYIIKFQDKLQLIIIKSLTIDNYNRKFIKLRNFDTKFNDILSININLNNKNKENQKNNKLQELIFLKENIKNNDWKYFNVQKGNTLAKLFRDNSLKVDNAFNMAKIEKEKKILSNLYEGQKIRLKVNKKGEVQLLETIDLTGKKYSFFKKNNSYYRTP
ncbi:LysM-like peptidoglycan-binding domain-containing protein [Candidatus Providencia siddallii]|uniref:Opacity-associated protein A domain-containing protein n=1 Tax=Candidatus Providencia siddallii TaxID=1715285 RepID=A0ABM9NPV8_9GAMM